MGVIYYHLRYVVSGAQRMVDYIEFAELLTDPFLFEGGVTITTMRFGNDAAAKVWMKKAGLLYK